MMLSNVGHRNKEIDNFTPEKGVEKENKFIKKELNY